MFANQNAYASKVTPGSTCKKVKQQEIYKGKVFTCIKLGKKLFWDNGRPFRVIPSPSPTVTNSYIPIPTQSASAKPSASPSASKSAQIPLLRESDVSFRAAKLTVTWSGMGIDQESLLNLRRLNVWILDSQVNPLITPLYRIAGFLVPNPGATFEVSLPNREHLVRISAVFLNGEETGYSATIRAIPNPVKVSLPTEVVAQWDKTDFKVSFVHDSSEEYLSLYRIRLDAGGFSKILEIKPSYGSSTQNFVLNLQGNQSLFGVPQTVIKGSVRTVDIFEREGAEVTFPAPVYKTLLTSP